MNEQMQISIINDFVNDLDDVICVNWFFVVKEIKKKMFVDSFKSCQSLSFNVFNLDDLKLFDEFDDFDCDKCC